MREDLVIKTAYHYPGISVLIPTQIGLKNEIVPRELPIPDEIPVIPGGLTFIRYIANLAFFLRDNPEEPVLEFDPPLELRINYRLDDVQQSNCDIQQLKLAYWDGENWVIISDPAHEYQILPPSTAQVAEVKIWSWLGDPPLAWGK